MNMEYGSVQSGFFSDGVPPLRGGAVHAFKLAAICHPPVCPHRPWENFGDKRSSAEDAGGPHWLIVRMAAIEAHLEMIMDMDDRS